MHPQPSSPDQYKRTSEPPFAELVQHLTLQYVTPSHNGQPPTEANTQIIRTNTSRRVDTRGQPINITRTGQLSLRGYTMNAKRVHQALLTGAWPLAVTDAKGRIKPRLDLPFGLGETNPESRAQQLSLSLFTRMNPDVMVFRDAAGDDYLATYEQRYIYCARYDHFIGKPDGAPDLEPPPGFDPCDPRVTALCA